MNNPCDAHEQEKSEYEKTYDRSRLAGWLKLATWTAQEGICLLCDIDPTGAVIRWDGFTSAQGTHVDAPKVEKGQLLTERPDHSYTTPSNEYFEITSEMPNDTWLSNEYFAAPPLLEPSVEDERHDAEYWLRYAWRLYVRNPKHADLSNRPPHEFVEWASSEGINVPWLAWAIVKGYLEDTLQASKSKEQNLTTKKRRNYLTVIAALLKELNIDIDKSPAASIAKMTEQYGRPIGEKTIRGYLKEIHDDISQD